MERPEVGEIISLLQRADILFACREEPVDRASICKQADCSRATAYRATADLKERGYLKRRAGGYQVTARGEAAVEQIRHFAQGFSGAQNLTPILRHVDAGGLVDAIHVFQDAAVFEATPHAPYSLEQKLMSIISDTSARLIGGTSSPSSAVVLNRTCELVRQNVEVEHVLTPSALEAVRAEHQTPVSEQPVIDETMMYVVDDVLLDLMVYDDVLVVPGPDDETGVLAAMAVTENPKAVSWALAHIARLRETGEPWPQ